MVVLDVEITTVVDADADFPDPDITQTFLPFKMRMPLKSGILIFINAGS